MVIGRFFKNIISGMGSVLVVNPEQNKPDWDPKKYLHDSAEDALREDWEKVGTDLLIASKRASDSSDKRG